MTTGAADVEVGAALLTVALCVAVVLVEVELEVELLSTAQVEKFAPPKSFPMPAAFVKWAVWKAVVATPASLAQNSTVWLRSVAVPLHVGTA